MTLWVMLLLWLACGTFMLGFEMGMRDMKRIDSKYGADHTYDAECWCRSPVGHSCVGLSDISDHESGGRIVSAQTFREWAESVDKVTDLDITLRDKGAVLAATDILKMTVKELLVEVAKANAADAIFEIDFGSIRVTLDVHIGRADNITAGQDGVQE